jgi:ribonucleoside-diphosphate reductase beta chain
VEAFQAVERIPSIRDKAKFCFKWIDSLEQLRRLETAEDRRTFLLNLICFGGAIEGIFFYAEFAYLYFMRSKGLLNGFASGTNWVFRDESCHMSFSYEVVQVAREEEPALFDAELRCAGRHNDRGGGRRGDAFRRGSLVLGCRRSVGAGHAPLPGACGGRTAREPRSALAPSGRRTRSRSWSSRTRELSNFFERGVSACQVAVEGDVAFDQVF